MAYDLFGNPVPVMTDPVYGRDGGGLAPTAPVQVDPVAPRDPLAPTSPVQVDPVPVRPTGPLGSMTNPHIAVSMPAPTTFATTDAAKQQRAAQLRTKAAPGFRNFLRTRRNVGAGGLMSLSSFPGSPQWRP